MIILDSDILAGFFKNEPNATHAIARAIASGEAVRTNTLSGHEVLYGEPLSRQREVKEFFKLLGSVSFDWEAMEESVMLRKHLKRKGTPIGKMDELIAGICLANKASILTRNQKHFSKVEGLKVKTW